MPNAQSVKIDGIKTEEISIKMLEKVEELSLHVIQLEGRVKNLKA